MEGLAPGLSTGTDHAGEVCSNSARPGRETALALTLDCHASGAPRARQRIECIATGLPTTMRPWPTKARAEVPEPYAGSRRAVPALTSAWAFRIGLRAHHGRCTGRQRTDGPLRPMPMYCAASHRAMKLLLQAGEHEGA